MLNDISSEKNIEQDFFRRLAQSIPEIEDAEEIDNPSAGVDDEDVDPDALDETLDPGAPGNGEDALPDIDTDMAEMQAVKDLIPWDSFSILQDQHYAKLLVDTVSLPEPKAKSKSFYIYYDPEMKRVDGILNKRLVGGYAEKEKLGDDLAFLKQLSPEGFPPEWKEKILMDIDEVPPVENSQIREKIREQQDLSDDKEEDKENKEEADQIQKTEDETAMPAQQVPMVPTQELPKPEPVGKMPAANLSQFHLRKLSRLESLKNIKGS